MTPPPTSSLPSSPAIVLKQKDAIKPSPVERSDGLDEQGETDKSESTLAAALISAVTPADGQASTNEASEGCVQDPPSRTEDNRESASPTSTPKRKRRNWKEFAIEEPVRKSNRTKVQPLQYWKNEKIVYNLVQDEEQGQIVPTIKTVLRSSSPEMGSSQTPSPKRRQHNSIDGHGPFSSKHRRKHQKDVEITEFDSVSEDYDDPDDENYNDKNEIIAEVNDFVLGETVSRTVAFLSTDMHYNEITNDQSNFDFLKTFDEGGFLFAGIIRLPARNGAKSAKKSRHNTLVFYVLEGCVEANLNSDTSFRVSRGGHFIIPRGNLYSMQSSGKKDTVLFFAQGTDTLHNSLNDEE
ncbi:Mif2/CENP-C like-domain-containing protein [Lipomyces arxii]|uniref:Mif2/CENP-C like-domain-containing protein n=1 Tax=Lipomyces arxii TaxID=56418 RepID=UPI0034CFFD45